MNVTTKTSRYGALLLATTLAAAVVIAAPAAHAVGSGTPQSTAVSTVPSTKTPNVTNGTVFAIGQVGGLTILGGSFTGVRNPGSTTTLTRADVLGFDASTGAVSTSFAPTLDGTVQAVAPGPSANTVYVGGYFNTVNGVRSKGITLLSTTTGAIVSGFKPPALNGPVQTIASSGGHLLIGGGFTLAGASTRQGLASLNPTTGALDSFLDVQLQGHHNYNGSGAKGALGARAMAVNPDGTRLVVLGNFKTADNLPRDQIVMIDINGSTANVDPNWATSKFTAACYRNSFDTYVTDVQYAPDGSYFAVTATGGSGTNSDGSRSLCDSASRWTSTATGTNVAPTWVDYTGNDTLWSVAVTGPVIYVGGHQRWLNNSNGTDSPGTGSVPRPGMAALDPISGLPLAWDPGRNPRGAGAYALLATTDGLYVGSDTDYFGNFAYKRQKIGFFPLAGGVAPASTSVATLPSNVYLAGALAGQDGLGTNDLGYRSVSGSTIGATTKVTNSVSWSTTRGAFVVGDTVFYGSTNGNFYRASFNGTSVGTPTVLDPYEDPKWSSVQTGSGQTYKGKKPGYYSELSSVTGAYYANGRMFYTLSGQRSLYWRWFNPDSGTIGADEFTITGADFSAVNGITASGDTLYYAKSDGTLHTMTFANLTLSPSTDTVFSGPAKDGRNWRARSLFLYGTVLPPNSGQTVSYTGVSSANALTASPSVTVPAATSTGDMELLFVTTAVTGVTTALPSGGGWTKVVQQDSAPLETTLFRRLAPSGDAGQSVSIALTSSTRVDLELAVYSGAGGAVATTSADKNTASHTTPAGTVTASGSWVVSYWAARSTAATSWTPPSAVTIRGNGVGTGGGHVDTMIGDSAAAVPGGSCGSLTATTGAVIAKGAMATVVLQPAS